MTVRIARVIASLALTLGLGGCTNFYEISIETPIQPKMDVSPFQRVLIAGFVTGGSEDVDTNLETVRLLRSQLRTPIPLASDRCGCLVAGRDRPGAGTGGGRRET